MKNKLVLPILVFLLLGSFNDVFGQTGCPSGSSCLVTSSYLGNTILGFNGSTYNLEGTSNNTGCGVQGTYDMDWGPDGNLYVASSLTSEVFKYSPSGNCLGVFVSAGSGGLSDPRGLEFCPDGSLLVTSFGNGKILKYNGTTGAFISVFSNGSDISVAPASMGAHMGIVHGPDGALWVADYTNSRVLRFNATTGAFLSVFADFDDWEGTRDLMFAPDGQLYITFRDAKKVLRYNYTTGALIDVFATYAEGLDLTSGITWGLDGLVYIGNVGGSTGSIVVMNPITKAVVSTITANTPKRIIFKCGVCFTATCTPPTATASATQPTCTGTNAPNNGKITIAGFTAGQRYQYTSGGTFTGTATPATITAIPAGGVITSTLPNTSGSYTVRIYDATDNACFVDRVVTITAVTCQTVDCNCTNNLITTPSFEGSDLSAWTTATNDPGGTILFSNDNPYAVCGTWYGYIRSANADAYNASVYQNIPATAGTAFTLNAYAGTHDPSQDSQIRLQFYDASNTLLSGGQTVQVDTDVDVAPFTLGKYTLTGTAPANTATVRVTFYTQGVYIGDNMAFKFDNVCLQATVPTCTPPTATASATQPTCTGTNSPNNGGITIAGFTIGQRYQYTSGGTFTGTATPATITAIPAGGVITSILANTSGSYTVRIYDATDDACYVDRTVTITAITCCTPPSPTGTGATLCAGNTATITVTGCDATYPAVWYSNAALTTQVGTGNSFTTPVLSTTTSYYVACVKDATCKSGGATVTATVTPLPIAGSPVVTQATCNAAGTAANNDASIAISGITNATVYAYTTDGSTPAFAGATAMSGGAINLTGIANPAAAVTYKFRIFNGSATCYIDITATLNPKTCSPTCVPPSPTGTGATLCAGNTATLTVTGCDATYPAVWYSNAALTTQVGTGNSFTTPVLSTTTSYYVACVKDATCKSSGATVTATVTPLPIAGTPVVTQATCNAAGTAANNDASIAISGITNATVYAYTTDGSTPAFAGATAVSGGVINLTALANPAAAVTYKFRIFNGSATCYIDITATLNPKTCSPTCVPPSPTGTGATLCAGNTATLTVTGCDATYPAVWYSNAALTTQVGTGNSFTTPVLSTTTSYYVACVKDATCKSSGATVTATVTPLPTAGTPVVTQATCNAAGTAANNDASIAISGITNATVYAYTTDGSTPAFAGATAVSGGAINLTALANPAAAVTYKFRIFNGSATCYIDITATLNPKTCSPTCVPPSPTGTGATLCAGNTATLTVTGCDATYPAVWYSNATLTTQVGTGNNFTTPVLSTTTSYYVACVKDASCKSSGATVTATVTPLPTIKGYGKPATCSSGLANSDAKIELYGIANATKYGYSLGTTYSGATYSGATTVTGATATISGLSSGAGNTTYTIRVFNGSDACYDDIQVIIPYSDCNNICTIDGGADILICQPTTTADFVDATATQEWVIGSLNPGGAAINASTGVVSGMSTNGIYSFILREKATPTCMDEVYVFRGVIELPFVSSCEATYQLPTIAGVTWTSVSGGASVTASGLITGMNTDGSYSFSASFGGCTSTIIVEKITCSPTCTTPSAGADMTICLPKTTLNLTDAASGTEWVAVSGNPATAVINATTGVITGMTVVGTYKFRLQKTGDATCSDEMQVVVTAAAAPIVLCNDGSTSYTLLAQAGYSNVIWYNMAGVQVGTGTSLIVKSMTLGLEDGSEAYYYEGTNSTDGCAGELCCPVKFMTQSCCPVPNCKTVTVIKN